MTDRFACPACGKTFAWKDALAGKQVRCKCGHTFTATRPAPVVAQAPAPPRAVVETEDVGEFDLYPEYDTPRQSKATVAKPPAAVHEKGDVPTPASPSPLAVYPGRPRRPAQQEEDTDAPSVWKDQYVPIGLAAVGIAAWVAMTVAFPLAGVSPAKALVVAGTMIVANIVALLVALFAAASLLSINFGPPGTAILKLVGIALFAGAVFFACMRLDYPKDIRGIVVGIHAALLVYGICFATLFDLELQETAITVAIIGLIQAMAGCVVMKV